MYRGVDVNDIKDYHDTPAIVLMLQTFENASATSTSTLALEYQGRFQGRRSEFELASSSSTSVDRRDNADDSLCHCKKCSCTVEMCVITRSAIAVSTRVDDAYSPWASLREVKTAKRVAV